MARACLTTWVLSGFALALNAQPKKDQPLALVLEASGGKLQLAGNASSHSIAVGDLLFAGDSVTIEGGSVKLLYCPEKWSAVIGGGTLTLRANAPPAFKGANVISRQTADPCVLPAMEREPEVASLDRVTRAVAAAGPETPDRQKIPEASRPVFDQLTAALVKAPNDPRLRLARGALLESAGLYSEAASDYAVASRIFPEQPRLRGLVHEAERLSGTPAPQGKTYALLIGISKYKLLKPDEQLLYADADAHLFRQFLQSVAGGSVPDNQIVELTNEQATVAAVRNQVNLLSQRAGKNDTVVLVVAAHGIMVRDRPYVVAANSNPQDFASTSYPMAYVQRLMFGQLAPFGRTLVFVDVCHSGQIGAILESSPVAGSKKEPEPTGEHLGLMASQKKEFAIEHQSFGGGHGAFSYFVVRGLVENEADADHNGVISAGELVDYVRASVAKATWNRQHPKDELGMEWDEQIAPVKPGSFVLGNWTQLPKTALNDILRQRSRAARVPPQTTQSPAPTEPAQIRERIQLENEGDDVLLHYQEGDEIPQTRDEFQRGLAAYGGALARSPESLYLQARAAFCEGRVAIFDKQYQAAEALLDRSIRLDPTAAFSYNAIGIAYLEQARYGEAEQAFQDAMRRAPLWAYPRHNLGLALAESGDYDGAILTIKQAMALAPQASYLPYSLGLVYQRVNRRGDAEAAYVLAGSLAPWRPEPDVALGLLAAQSGKSKEAEAHYRAALARKPSGQTLLSARHNLALLLSARRNGVGEALDLWRENGDYLPSQLGLAETQVRLGNHEDALREYRDVLARQPDLSAVSLSLAAELERLRRYDEGVAVLTAALQYRTESIPLLERMAALQMEAGRTEDARRTYQQALGLARDPATAKRLDGELKRAGRREDARK